jgi:hypothetical protein
MNPSTVRRVTAGAGLASALLVLIEIPLYFVYDGPPPDSNVLTRSLIGLIGLTFLVVFMTNLRQLIKQANPVYEWVATLASTAGLLWLAVEFVSTGLETGAVIQSASPIDPTITVSGTYILYGTISRLLVGLFMISLGYAVVRTRVLPRWVGWTAFAMAAVNLAFVPSIYHGNNPANFYAANGWGTTASIGGIFAIWLLATSIATFRPPAIR